MKILFQTCIACFALCCTATIAADKSPTGSNDAAAKPAMIRVASVSILPEKWNKAANADKIEKLVRQAAEQKAELVITPEGVLEGYVVNEVIREKDAAKKTELTKKFRETA